MKIEFLNDELTEARATRGWFRKRVAYVRTSSTGYWIFTSTGRDVGLWVREWIYSARNKAEAKRARALRDEEWVAVEKLPEARLLRDAK